ncbi:MAG: hypothetical protein LBI20_03750 [Holosporales bacterium]|jgi:hypothetical protein|nr:hypothetical protein [Holosporales bacterium]
MKEALAQTRCGQAEDNLQSALDKHDALEEQVAQEAINVAKQEIDLINHKLDTLNLVFAQLETSIHDRTKKKWEEHSSLRIALLKHLALGTEIPTQQMEQLQELWPSDPQQVDELIIQTGQRALQEINPDAPTVGFRTQRLTSWLTICYDPRIQGAMTSAQIGQCTLQEELNGPRNIALYSYPPAAQDPFLTLTQVLLAFPTTLVEFSHTPGLPQASVRITEVIKEFHQDHIKDHTMEANNPYGWWNITVNSLTDQYTPGPNPPPMPDMFEAEAELLLAQTDRNSQIYQDLLAVIRDEQSPSLETIKELVRLHRTHPLATAFLINLVSYEALPTSPQRASSTSQGIRRLITDISDPLFLRYLYSAQHRQRIPEQGITQFPPQGNTISALARQDTIQELTHLLEKFPSWMDPIERKFRTAIPQVGNKGDGHSSLLATLKAYTCPLPATEQPESAVESRPARLILESQEPETGTLLATLEDESNHDSGDADPASLVPAREAETGTLPAPVVEEPIEASGVADSPPVQAQKVRSRPATQGDAREARTAAKKPARRQRVAIEPQHSTQAFDDEL